MIKPTPPVLSMTFTHSQSQARKKEEGCGRLIASVNFGHSIIL